MKKKKIIEIRVVLSKQHNQTTPQSLTVTLSNYQPKKREWVALHNRVWSREQLVYQDGNCSHTMTREPIVMAPNLLQDGAGSNVLYSIVASID